MKPILTRRQHAGTDFSYIPLAAALPTLAKFDDDKVPATLTRVLAGSILLSSVFTRSEWGLIRTMSYKRHCQLDIGLGFFASLCPWLFGFSKNKRATISFLGLGLMGITAGLTSLPAKEMKPGSGDFETLSATAPKRIVKNTRDRLVHS